MCAENAINVVNAQVAFDAAAKKLRKLIHAKSVRKEKFTILLYDIAKFKAKMKFTVKPENVDRNRGDSQHQQNDKSNGHSQAILSIREKTNDLLQ